MKSMGGGLVKKKRTIKRQERASTKPAGSTPYIRENGAMITKANIAWHTEWARWSEWRAEERRSECSGVDAIKDGDGLENP